MTNLVNPLNTTPITTTASDNRGSQRSTLPLFLLVNPEGSQPCSPRVILPPVTPPFSIAKP